jgi:Ca2+:H+ antiporter
LLSGSVSFSPIYCSIMPLHDTHVPQQHFYVDDPVTTSSHYPEQLTNQVNSVHEKMHLPHRRKKHDEEEGMASSPSTISDPQDPHTVNGNSPSAGGLAGAEMGSSGGQVTRSNIGEVAAQEEEEDEEQPQMNIVMTIVSPPDLVLG